MAHRAPGAGTSHKPPLFDTLNTGSSRSGWFAALLPWLLVVALATFLLMERCTTKPLSLANGSIRQDGLQQISEKKKIYVSYSYFEKDLIQVWILLGFMVSYATIRASSCLLGHVGHFKSSHCTLFLPAFDEMFV
jgi:hypothetical protein